MRKISYIIIFLFSHFICGCIVMEASGRFLDGSMFDDKVISHYKYNETGAASQEINLYIVENDGIRSILISLDRYPMIKLRGGMPDGNGSFTLTSLDYFASSFHGWNEYSSELIGGGNLILQNTAALEMDNDIVNHQITKGRTHLFDTRITGDEALTSLRNRKERITSLCEWMLSLNGPRQQSIKDFDKHWKPLLFPEMVRSSQRPSGWRQEGDIFERSSDISWNTGFTDRVFPEELRPVRNSGTLLRDWEEALSWVYYQYEWENITALLSGRIILNKIK